jgi:hypothetical protein
MFGNASILAEIRIAPLSAGDVIGVRDRDGLVEALQVADERRVAVRRRAPAGVDLQRRAPDGDDLVVRQQDGLRVDEVVVEPEKVRLGNAFSREDPG